MMLVLETAGLNCHGYGGLLVFFCDTSRAFRAQVARAGYTPQPGNASVLPTGCALG